VNDKIITVAPRPATSIEGTLAAAGNTYAFLDYHKASGVLHKSQDGTLGDFQPAQGVWPEVFDGLFFIARVYPVERTGK
jgi:erythromycin esterase